MKATTLLEHQHRNLQELCEAVQRGSVGVRRSLLPQLAGDLAALFTVEEQVFYPAACAALHEEGWSSAGRSWHVRARRSLDRALEAPVDGEEFERAMGELRSAVDRYAEEEGALYPQLERALDGGSMRRLGLSMMSLYDSEVEAGYVPSSRRTPAA
ncbi:MAG: hypothetical protein ACRELB_08915 [Polyangiaceae bacterium]